MDIQTLKNIKNAKLPDTEEGKIYAEMRTDLSYITKDFPIVQDVKPGGIFLINCQWNLEELEHHLSSAAKSYIARTNIQL